MNILFIGPLPEDKYPRGGDQFKNTILYELLSKHFNVYVLNSVNWHKSIYFWLNLFKYLFIKKKDRIVLSVSYGSAIRLISLLSRIKYPLGKLAYVAIGGYIGKYIKNNPNVVQHINKLQCVIVEGSYIKNEIESTKTTTPIYVLPNIKKFNLNVTFQNIKDESVIKFVFISRIIPEKGVREIFEASKLIKNDHPELRFSVTFFGPVDPDFAIEFNRSIGDNCTYQGSLDLVKNQEFSYNQLSRFDCMLFPTYYPSEGFPGVIVDAFITGLPIIVTRWNMNEELIRHNHNGLLILPHNVDDLARAMVEIIKNKNLREKFSKNNLAIRHKYHADTIESTLVSLIQK